jgi:hypothetical protein
MPHSDAVGLIAMLAAMPRRRLSSADLHLRSSCSNMLNLLHGAEAVAAAVESTTGKGPAEASAPPAIDDPEPGGLFQPPGCNGATPIRFLFTRGNQVWTSAGCHACPGASHASTARHMLERSFHLSPSLQHRTLMEVSTNQAGHASFTPTNAQEGVPSERDNSVDPLTDIPTIAQEGVDTRTCVWHIALRDDETIAPTTQRPGDGWCSSALVLACAVDAARTAYGKAMRREPCQLARALHKQLAERLATTGSVNEQPPPRLTPRQARRLRTPNIRDDGSSPTIRSDMEAILRCEAAPHPRPSIDLDTIHRESRKEAENVLFNPKCTGGECMVLDGPSGVPRPQLPPERSARDMVLAVGYDIGGREWKRVCPHASQLRSPTLHSGMYILPDTIAPKCMTAKLTIHLQKVGHHVTMPVVVDSEAAWSAFRRDAFNALLNGSTDDGVMSTTTLRFHGVTGDTLRVDGSAMVVMNIAGYEFITRVYVFEQMAVPALLGVNTLRAHGLVIDGARNILYPALGNALAELPPHAVPIESEHARPAVDQPVVFCGDDGYYFTDANMPDLVLHMPCTTQRPRRTFVDFAAYEKRIRAAQDVAPGIADEPLPDAESVAADMSDVADISDLDAWGVREDTQGEASTSISLRQGIIAKCTGTQTSHVPGDVIVINQAPHIGKLAQVQEWTDDGGTVELYDDEGSEEHQALKLPPAPPVTLTVRPEAISPSETYQMGKLLQTVLPRSTH